jgi:hypothetical protein
VIGDRRVIVDQQRQVRILSKHHMTVQPVRAVMNNYAGRSSIADLSHPGGGSMGVVNAR